MPPPSGGWPPPTDRGTDFDAPGQLYDIARDPEEQDNVWAERPDLVARLTALLDGYRESGRSAATR